MFVLAFDTTTEYLSIALWNPATGQKNVFSQRRPREQSTLLHETIKQVMAEEGVSFQQVSAVAVLRGPGSFTGIRVGVAAAKGLALAVGCPLVGLSSFEVFAASVTSAEETQEGNGASGVIAVPAWGKDVYAQSFIRNTLVGTPAMMSEEAALNLLKTVRTQTPKEHTVLAVGGGFVPLQEHLPHGVIAAWKAELLAEDGLRPSPVMLAQLAWSKHQAGTLRAEETEALPLYLHNPAYAQVKKEV